MSVYKRGGVYWYDFWFQGQRYQQSTSLNNKTAALRAEAIRKAELAEGKAGIVRRKACPNFQQFIEEEFLPWSKKEHERNWGLINGIKSAPSRSRVFSEKFL